MQRARKVKSKAVLEKMQGNSEDIFYPNWVDVHYPERPEEIENICLYDFLSNFDIVDNKPKDTIVHFQYKEKYLRKRKTPYLINHYNYNVNTMPENYYHSLLLLFKPWRRNEDLLPPNVETYEEAFLHK